MDRVFNADKAASHMQSVHHGNGDIVADIGSVISNAQTAQSWETVLQTDKTRAQSEECKACILQTDKTRAQSEECKALCRHLKMHNNTHVRVAMPALLCNS